MKSIGGDFPVTGSELLSTKVLEIPMKNSESHGDLFYSSGEYDYYVSFEFRLDDSNVGVYYELPESLTT